MKKTYSIPEMETIELKMSCTMLAGSLTKGSTPVTDEGNVLSPEFELYFDE